MNLRKRLLLSAIVGVILGSAAGAVVAHQQPPVFEASLKLLIEKRAKTSAGIPGVTMPAFDFGAFPQGTNLALTVKEFLFSTPILDKVIRQLDLRDPLTGELIYPEQFLESARVEPVKRTDIIELTYRHRRPLIASQVVDTWASLFIEHSREGGQQDISRAALLLKTELGQTQAALSMAESELRDYKRTHLAVDIGEQARVALAGLESVEGQYRLATVAYQEAASQVKTLRSQLGRASGEGLTAMALAQDPTIVRLRQKLLEAETNPILADHSRTSDAPEARNVAAQVASLRKRLADEGAAIARRRYQGLMTNVDPVRQAMIQDLGRAEVLMLSHAARMDALRQQIASTGTERLRVLPDKELTLSRLVRNAAALADKAKALAQAYENTRIQGALAPDNSRVIEPASIPGAPLRSHQALYWTIGGAVGGLVGLLLAWLWSRRRRPLHSIDQVTDQLHLPVACQMPCLDGALPVRELLDARFGQSVVDALTLLAADSPPQALAITGDRPGVGRTSTTVALALAMARAGKQVIVVDLDFRDPALHTYFGQSAEPGFTTVVAGSGTLAGVIRGTGLPGIDVLPAGARPPSSEAILRTKRVEVLLKELRATYDFVLIDAPTALDDDDLLLLASHVDAILVVAELGQTASGDVARVLSQLGDHEILQAVIVRPGPGTPRVAWGITTVAEPSPALVSLLAPARQLGPGTGRLQDPNPRPQTVQLEA